MLSNHTEDSSTPEIPKELQRYFGERDGAAILVKELPKYYRPQQVATASNEQRVWELIGLFYLNQEPKRRLKTGQK